MSLRLERITDRLPAGFEQMKLEADAEGYRFVERLRAEWEAHITRFDREDETMLAARIGETLAGIGGITRDPVITDALRMRRFYVRPAFRGQGIGRALVEAVLAYPRVAGRTVVVNAGRGSSSFWEAYGFVTDSRDGHTHILTKH
jgi:GNAT superfamily N-acetyltransferase